MSYGVFECSDWLDLTSPVGIRSTSFSYRIIPVAWDIESVVLWFESHSGAGNHDEGSLIFQGVYPVPSMFDYWLFSALFWVIKQYVSRFICCNNYFASFDKSMTLFCRHFLGIFSLVIWKPRDSWKYFQEFVIAIASIAFSNGATNWIRISLSFVFVYSVCIIIVGFFSRIFSLAHVCHVVGSSEYSGTMWPFNGTFSQWFYIYSVSSSTMLKVTWNPEWNVILRSVGRYRKSFDGRSWYVHGFSWLVLLRHVTSRELTRHSCRDDMGLMPVGKSGSLHILVSVYSELCGTQRVESLKCGNEFTLKVYGYQLHNGQLRQRHVRVLKFHPILRGVWYGYARSFVFECEMQLDPRINGLIGWVNHEWFLVFLLVSLTLL